MSGSGLNDVLQAVVTVLRADAPFMAAAKQVYDYVPDSAAYPYITVGDATEVPFDTFGKDGHQITLSVHIWSQANGYKESFAILDLLTALVENTPLPLADHQQVMANTLDVTAERDPDGITRHVFARFRIIVQDN